MLKASAPAVQLPNEDAIKLTLVGVEHKAIQGRTAVFGAADTAIDIFL